MYQTISEHREKGKTFDQIAEWLNEKGYLSVRGKKFRGAHVHSIVTECFGYGVLWYPNTLLSFDLNLSSQNLRVPSYSDYQHFLYETITKFRKDGMNDVQIANWLNDNGHPTPRGNKFKNAHVHSIAKKRKRRLQIIDRKPTLPISDINLRYKKNG